MKNWEKEFDENINNLPVMMEDVPKFFKENPDSLYGEEMYPESILELDGEKIKSFIRNLLAEQENMSAIKEEERQHIIKIIEKMDVSELMAEEVLQKLKSSIEEI